MLTLEIPKINDSLTSFDLLFDLWERVDRDDDDLSLSFSECDFLGQNAVAFLGGLIRIVQGRGHNASAKLKTLQPKVRQVLERNGFLETFFSAPHCAARNAIPYREDRALDAPRVMEYLKLAWLGRGWVNVSERLKAAIVGRVWELYANAFEHAGSPTGVISCGQHFPNLGWLKLTVVDFGVGIPTKVKAFAPGTTWSPSQALAWAFQRGTTTTPGGTGRGLGLDLVKEFVKVNGGKLEVFSEKGYGRVNATGERFTDRERGFRGTLLNITLRCNESYYFLASEAESGPLF